ncbi:putative transcriptional regulator of N-Acetylglucosamine utilization, GntR family [Pseudonocardia sp. Ae168_Ps1]|uniref:GntR family transcriptional regulator n=1 Tax=unclassified Pseudonocardia TaxID=2619320 RepID=UPI00094A9CBB|nr:MULTISPECIES: GntR family transcriptional regulator [unclassified Pseudonocardia]OLL72908.1 putative transcriptional regulator of N-Acetylglucosamine utilization, GntR family [Pseudonocardia sp. Ae150A_Ps1]OLL78883.1 putative transcriptional regulator of N-Acetylglucosamine utilization, GntR family [Pseudonocardia sp. Ae168_Ps1]OLL86978.1 putative transcriptional regulator of N-Acetylglucosamine utilization, GntR family [Pseudonocardia sp. Ae263_Ps1]OLL92978.1 putative transcriptional regula
MSRPGRLPTVPHPRASGGTARGRHTFPRRVREMLRASVRGGYLVVDDKLVEDQLMESLNASRSAVRAALQQLADEGFVDRQQRRGTVVVRRGVAVRLRDTVTALGATEVTLQMAEQGGVPSTPLLRHRLGVPDAVLRMNENIFRADGEVIGVRTAYFPSSFTTPSYAGPAALDVVFADFFGVGLGRVQTEIGAAGADDRTGRLLGVAPGAPVLLREQLFHDEDDRPVQVVFDNYRADRVTFVDDPDLG